MPAVKNRWTRQIVVGTVAVLIGGFLALIRVLDFSHTAMLIAAVVGLDYLISQGRGRATESWPAPPLRFRGGARTEVAQLAWATVDRNGDVSPKVLQRVRALAQVSLAQHGVSWSGKPGTPMHPLPLAQQLLGAPAVTTLTTKGKVRPRALANVVQHLESLSATNLRSVQ